MIREAAPFQLARITNDVHAADAKNDPSELLLHPRLQAIGLDDLEGKGPRCLVRCQFNAPAPTMRPHLLDAERVS